MSLAIRLKQARERAGLTQVELQAKSGVPQQAISKIEKGLQGSTAFVVRLAVACGVRPEWLDSGEEPMLRIEGYTTNDPKLIAMCRVMEGKAEYVKDAAVKEVTQILELVDRTRESSGTDG